VRRASPVFPPRRRRTPNYGEAGGRRLRRCKTAGQNPKVLRFPVTANPRESVRRGGVSGQGERREFYGLSEESEDSMAIHVAQSQGAYFRIYDLR
jgi:hypothetical protein